MLTNIYNHRFFEELSLTRYLHFDILCSYIFITERQKLWLLIHMTNFISVFLRFRQTAKRWGLIAPTSSRQDRSENITIAFTLKYSILYTYNGAVISHGLVSDILTLEITNFAGLMANKIGIVIQWVIVRCRILITLTKWQIQTRTLFRCIMVAI